MLTAYIKNASCYYVTPKTKYSIRLNCFKSFF